MDYFTRHFRPKIHFEKSGDNGSGSVTVDWPEDVLKGFRSLISKEGSEKDAAMKLYDENYEYRKQLRDLKKQAEEANTLTAEEFALFTQYKELGQPDELKTKIEAAETATAELAVIKKEKSINAAADVLGWNPKVLNKLGGDLEYEVKTKTGEDGKAIQYVEAKDGDKIVVVTDDFAKEKFGEEFLPSLKKEPTAVSTENGRSFPAQTSSTGKVEESGDDLINSMLNANKKARGIEVKE